MAISFPDVTESKALDLATICKATQAISEELELELILKTFLNITISDACKCILLLQLEQQLQVAALVESGQEPQIFPPIAIESTQNMMISSIDPNLVDRVRISLEPLVVDRNNPQVTSDRSNQESQTIVYLPLLRQDQLIGILYLEHNLEFTSDRLEVLSLICSQAAIAIQNSHVHTKLAEEYQILKQEFNETKIRYTDLTDISDRKQAEAALQESEERFQLALEGSGDGLWDWSIPTGDIYLSPRWLEMLGYEVDDLPQHIDTWASLIHPEDAPWVTQILNAHLQDSSVPYAFDYRVLTKSGTWKWIANYGKVLVRDEDLQPLRMLGTHRDITDRKQSELALQSLLEGTAAFTGKEFIPELVKQIAIALDVAQVYLTQLNGDNLDTIAWYADHQVQPNLSFKIANTPCELAFQAGIYACGLKQLFPLAEDLERMNNLDNYLGVAMENTSGEKLGVLYVLNHQPIPNPERAEVILRIFAQRAIAELERLQTLEYLQNLNEELEQRVQERTKEIFQARNFLEAIIENIHLSLFVKNGKAEKFGEFLLWNKTCETMFGLTKEQAIGKSVYDFFPQEQSDFFNEKDRSSFALAKIEDIPEESIDSLTLGTRILHTIKVPIFDEHGDPDYLICISEDISDRKKAEFALQKSEQRFRAAFEQVSVGIAELNLNGQFLKLNQKFCHILGYAEAELLNKSFNEITHPDDLAKDLENIRKIMAGEIEAFFSEKRYINKEGQIIWANLNVSLVHNLAGNPQYLIAVIKDISDRKQAEAQLREQEQLLRNMYEGVEHCICLVNVSTQDGTNQGEFHFVGWNRATEKIIGILNADIIGKTPEELLGETQGAIVRQHYQRCLDAGTSITYEEMLPFQDRDIWWLTTLNPLKDTNGNIYRIVITTFEITDRKQAEIALNQSEHDLRTIFNNVNDAIFIQSLDGKLVNVNERALELMGATLEQILSTTIVDVSGPDAPLEMIPDILDRVSSGETVRIEWQSKRLNDNSIFDSEFYLKKITLNDQPLLMAGMADISDRKQAEIALRESEERFRNLFEATPTPIQGYDYERRVIFWNKASENLYGYTKLEAMGRRVEELIIPESIKFNILPMVDAWIAGTGEALPDGELQLRNKNNESVTVYSSHVKLNNLQSESEMYCIDIDLSDRKRIEKELFENEAKFRRLVEDADHLVYVISPEGNFTYLSPQIKTIFGYEVSEYIGKSFAPLTHPEDLQKVIESNTRLFNTGQVQNNLEFRAKHQDDSLIWISCSNSPIKDEKGLVIGFQGVAQDISDRKQMEEDIATLYEEIWKANSSLEKANTQLEAYSNNLESLVDERTTQLKSAQMQIIAQEKLASLGTLTAGVAHEIRNPLNFVKNYAEGSIELGQDLMDTLEPLMPSIDENISKLIKILIADLQENSNAIQRHSDRAEKVINSMMQYTRNDNEKIVTQSSDLNELIDQSLKLASFSKRMIDTNFYLAIRTNYAANLDMVDIFPSSLGRAIINLVENACDAMRFKQAKLQTENPTLEYEPTLNISTHSIAEIVEIRIKDNGCGIPLDIQNKILDPFFTTKPPGEGTGLGLSLTHDIIVNQHQGTLAIDSQLGEYTEIIITLPYIKNLRKASDP